jgi:hypothetical protein
MNRNLLPRLLSWQKNRVVVSDKIQPVALTTGWILFRYDASNAERFPFQRIATKGDINYPRGAVWNGEPTHDAIVCSIEAGACAAANGIPVSRQV